MGHAVCYSSSAPSTTDCGGPPLLGSGTGLTSGDGITATTGSYSSFWVLDAANTSGAAATLFTNGVTLGAGGTCNLQYNGGGCFTGTASEVDLAPGGHSAYQFKIGNEFINNSGQQSTLDLKRRAFRE